MVSVSFKLDPVLSSFTSAGPRPHIAHSRVWGDKIIIEVKILLIATEWNVWISPDERTRLTEKSFETVKAREVKFWDNIKLPHQSCVTCLVSGVTYHMSKNKNKKVVKVVVWGSVITGPTPSRYNCIPSGPSFLSPSFHGQSAVSPQVTSPIAVQACPAQACQE